MGEPNKALNWDLVQKLVEFVKDVIAENKRKHNNAPAAGDNDVALSPIDTVEAIKNFYSPIEKAVPVRNVAGENQGTLWIEGSFYEGEERKNKRLSIGTWLSCRIDDTTIPVWVGVSDEHPELYAWCPRESAYGATVIECLKADIGSWRYDRADDAYWTPLSEKDERERDLRKSLKEKLRELHDKDKRAAKQGLPDDLPTKQKM